MATAEAPRTPPHDEEKFDVEAKETVIDEAVIAVSEYPPLLNA